MNLTVADWHTQTVNFFVQLECFAHCSGDGTCFWGCVYFLCM